MYRLIPINKLWLLDEMVKRLDEQRDVLGLKSLDLDLVKYEKIHSFFCTYKNQKRVHHYMFAPIKIMVDAPLYVNLAASLLKMHFHRPLLLCKCNISTGDRSVRGGWLNICGNNTFVACKSSSCICFVIL